MDLQPQHTKRPELGSKDIAPYLALWRLVLLEGLAYEPPSWRRTPHFRFICGLAGIPLDAADIITRERAVRILRLTR